MNKLLIASTPEIMVPKTMALITKAGKTKEFNTLTKTGSISRRNKKPVIIFSEHNDNFIEIKKAGQSKKLISDSHLKSIRDIAASRINDQNYNKNVIMKWYEKNIKLLKKKKNLNSEDAKKLKTYENKLKYYESNPYEAASKNIFNQQFTNYDDLFF